MYSYKYSHSYSNIHISYSNDNNRYHLKDFLDVSKDIKFMYLLSTVHSWKSLSKSVFILRTCRHKHKHAGTNRDLTLQSAYVQLNQSKKSLNISYETQLARLKFRSRSFPQQQDTCSFHLYPLSVPRRVPQCWRFAFRLRAIMSCVHRRTGPARPSPPRSSSRSSCSRPMAKLTPERGRRISVDNMSRLLHRPTFRN